MLRSHQYKKNSFTFCYFAITYYNGCDKLVLEWLISANLNATSFPLGGGDSSYKLYGYGYKYKLYGYGEIKRFCSMHNRVFSPSRKLITTLGESWIG